MRENQYYDCILIHTPKFNYYFHPLGRVGFVNIIPTGLFAIADNLVRNGFKTKIIHMGLKRLINPNTQIKEILKDYKAKIYGLSLMWHYQSCEVIEIAKTIKELYPDSVVVLGGITATIFKKEILSRYPFIDFIIAGEAEIPFLRFVEEITKNPKAPNLSSVPNLFYGNTEPYEIISTPQELFDELSFLRPELLEDFELYNKLHFFTKYDNKYLNQFMNFTRPFTSPLWYITLGRGCFYQCSFCAAKYNLINVLHRKTPILRAIDSVLSDIENARKHNIKKLTSAFYFDKREDYFIKFLAEFSKHFRDISINFDCWGIPSLELIDVFSTLNKNSAINVMIYSLSEKLRNLNNVHRFGNEELIKSIRYAKKRKVTMRIILCSGFPFEDKEAIDENLRVAKEIRSIDHKSQIIFLYTELAPGSDMYNKPEKYKITSYIKSFDDIIEINKSGKFFFGYSFYGMSESQLQRTKCEKMCFINNKYGRLVCTILHKVMSRF